MKRIVVVVEGGLVQNVLTDEPAEVVVVDHDTEGADQEELSVIGDDTAYVRRFDSEVNLPYVQAAFK